MVCFNTTGLALTSIWTNKIFFDEFKDLNWLSQFRIDTWNSSIGCCTPNVVPFYNSKSTIVVNDNFLNMQVNPNVSPMLSSSISSIRDDILYGSFRISAKFPNINGTSFGFFFFNSTNQEIDIEVLMHEVYENKLRTAVQPIIRDPRGRASNLSQRLVIINGSMTNSFIEYRFDWFKDRIDYYIDSKYSHSLIVNIPFLAGKILINHHSNGNPMWSRGPPFDVSTVIINYIELYFNSSLSGECNSEFNLRPYNSPNGSSIPPTWRKYIIAIIVSSIIVGIFLISGIVYGVSKYKTKQNTSQEIRLDAVSPEMDDITEQNTQRDVAIGTRRV